VASRIFVSNNIEFFDIISFGDVELVFRTYGWGNTLVFASTRAAGFFQIVIVSDAFLLWLCYEYCEKFNWENQM